jgi:hypothetical protein
MRKRQSGLPHCVLEAGEKDWRGFSLILSFSRWEKGISAILRFAQVKLAQGDP